MHFFFLSYFGSYDFLKANYSLCDYGYPKFSVVFFFQIETFSFVERLLNAPHRFTTNNNFFRFIIDFEFGKYQFGKLILIRLS